MKSYDFYAVTYDSSIYCINCLPKGISVKDERVFPIFADSEWEYVPACDRCGREHDYITLLRGNDL